LTHSDDEAVSWLAQVNPVESDTQLTTEVERRRVFARVTAEKPRRARSWGWSPRFTLATAVMTVVALVAIVMIPSLLRPQPAQAVTPQPLQFSETSMESHEMMTHLRGKLDASGSSEPVRGADYVGWFTDIRPDDSVPSFTYIAPQRVSLTWEADLSGRQVTEAAEAYWADPNETTDLPDVPPAGTILDEMDFAPGEFQVPFSEPFGDSDADVLEALQALGMPEDYDAADLIDYTDNLMSLWTLTPAQHSTLLSLLERVGDIRLLGSATDRLGRAVIGYATESSRYPGTTRVLLIEESSGLIVGVENTNVAAQPPLPAGAVTSYTLWKGKQ